MKLYDYPKELREALATWELFREMGFEADDIRTGVINGPAGRKVAVQARKRRFNVCDTTMSPKTFASLWNQLSEDIKSFPEEDLQRSYAESRAREHKNYVMMLMVKCGEFWPNYLRDKARVNGLDGSDGEWVQ